MMKRIKLRPYVMRTKWLVLLLVTLTLIIFGRTVNSPELTKTAIVLGAGIDYLEDSGEFLVTTQSVIMASSSSESSGQTSYQTFTAKGETISSALDDISRKMGLIISLAHCNVLIVSQSVLKLDHMQLIYPLTGMYSLPELAMVVSGDKSPRELLAMRVGTTISAPYFLQLALSNKEGTNGMIRTNVKDLLARSLSRSEAAVIPYISAKEMTDQPMDQQGELKDNFEFELSSTLAFNHSSSHVITGRQAEVLSLYLTKATFGALNYKSEDGKSVEFRILNKSVESKANGRNIEAKIELIVELLDVQFIASDKVLTGSDEVIKEAADALARELTATLTELFELSKGLNIDFLGLQAKAYQSVGRHLEEDCLSTLTFSPEVSLAIKETA